MSCIKKLLDAINIFPVKILSILFCIIIGAITYYCFGEMYSRVSPSVVESTVPLGSDSILFNTSKGVLAIGFPGVPLKVWSGFVTVNFSSRALSNGKPMRPRFIPLVPCKPEFFPEDFVNIEIESFICTPPGYVFNISGTYTSTSPFSYLQLHTAICKNSTKNQYSCKSEDEIQRFFNPSNGSTPRRIQFYYTNNFVDTADYDHPIKRKMDNKRWFLPANSTTQIQAFVTKLTVISNSLWYPLGQPTIVEGLCIDLQNFESSTFHQDGGPPIHIDTIADNSKRVYNRHYQTLIDTFAKIGGLKSVLYQFFSIISIITVAIIIWCIGKQLGAQSANNQQRQLANDEQAQPANNQQPDAIIASSTDANKPNTVSEMPDSCEIVIHNDLSNSLIKNKM